MSKKNNKNGSGLVGALTGFTVLALLTGVGWPIVGILAAVGAGKLAKHIFGGLDLTTHNRQDLQTGEQPRPSTVQRPAPVTEIPTPAQAQANQNRRAAEKTFRETYSASASNQQPTAAGRTTRRDRLEIDTIRPSGDAQADAVIEKGREMIHKIREENEAIPDAQLSYQMDQLERICTQIFRTVSEQPTKAPQIRKFMNYYLPTTLKMLSGYHTMQDRGVSYGDMKEAQTTLTRGLDMILTACQKQLDNLYKDTMLDVTTDIDVLEKMLERDGFKDGELMDNLKNGTAAAGSMASGVPVLKVPDSYDVTDEPVSLKKERY